MKEIILEKMDLVKYLVTMHVETDIKYLHVSALRLREKLKNKLTLLN